MAARLSRRVRVSNHLFTGLLPASYRAAEQWGYVMISTVQEDRLETARDATTTIGRIRKPETSGVVVELHGEFDDFDLQRLRDVLDDAPDSGKPIRVDLSGVTFLDARCARELVVRCLACGGRLALHDPSWQAATSLEASGQAPTGGSTQGGSYRGSNAPGMWRAREVSQAARDPAAVGRQRNAVW